MLARTEVSELSSAARDSRFSWPRILLAWCRRYRWRHGRLPNLLRPKGFNEKLLRRMIFDRDPRITRVAGKLGAQAEVLRRTGDASLLPRSFGVARSLADLAAIKLPPRFVMKANHGSGMIAFFEGPQPPDPAHIAALTAEWLQTDYAAQTLEWCYAGVERAVIFEEYLQAADGVPADYKFLCFGGVARVIQYSSARFTGHTISLFDRDWRCLPAQLGKYPRHETPPPRPTRLDDMLAVAEHLAADWDFLRVDLYQVGGEIKFGELTNYPFAAGAAFSPPEWERRIGDYWR